MSPDIKQYNESHQQTYKSICDLLHQEITNALPNAESKVWHGSPVWFLEGNPVAGYSALKNCVQLLFWSGQSFDEPDLQPNGSFKAAEARYTEIDEINADDLRRWLKKSQTIQWDYKNIVKRRGVLERLK